MYNAFPLSEEIAYQYLNSSSSERATLKSSLIKAGASIVHDLLRAGIKLINVRIPKVRRELEEAKSKSEMGFFMGQIGEGFAIKESVDAAEGLAVAIGQVVANIGQTAVDELSNVLRASNMKESILAALILHRVPYLSTTAAQRVRDLIRTFDYEPKYRQGEFVFLRNMVLLFFARRVGDEGFTGNLNAMARREGLTSLTELEEHWRIYGWRFLYDNWGQGN